MVNNTLTTLIEDKEYPVDDDCFRLNHFSHEKIKKYNLTTLFKNNKFINCKINAFKFSLISYIENLEVNFEGNIFDNV